MNEFLDQFYNLPIDNNHEHLKKIFGAKYNEILKDLKSIKELTLEDTKLKYKLYLYTFKQSQFLLTKFDQTVCVEYLYSKKVTPLKLELKYIDDRNFEISYHFDAKSIWKKYVILNYNDKCRFLLKSVECIDINNVDTNAPTIEEHSIYAKVYTWKNSKNQIHSFENLPAIVIYNKNKSVVLNKFWYKKDKIHRNNSPAELAYDIKGRLKKVGYYANDKKHRLQEPAEFYYRYNEMSLVSVWYEYDELLRSEKEKITVLFDDIR